MNTSKKALVIGGSGFLGSAVCNQLAKEGFTLTVPTRRYNRGRHLSTLPTCKVVQANIHDRAALSRLVEGQDLVVNLLGVLHSKKGKPYGPAFRQNHVEFPKALCAVMSTKKVQRLIHVSALGVGGKSPAPSMYLRSKTDGEAVIKDSALKWTILRPSVVFGRTDRFLNLFASLARLSPIFPLAGAHAKFQPVAVEDVAQAIRLSATTLKHETVHRTYDLAGPETYTLEELVKLAGNSVGKSPTVIPIPSSIGKVQAFFMELAPGEPLMSRDNIDSMSIDNISKGGQLFPLPRYTSLKATAPKYLKERHDQSFMDVFRQSAHRRG